MAKIFKHRTDVAFFDYKDFKTLQRYINQYGQIETRKRRIEKKEDPLTALKRELKEETSLRVDELSITEISSYRLTKDAWNDTKRHEYLFYLFRVKIPDLNFEVYEGDGAEAYHKNEIESLDDLDKPEKYALKEIAGEI
jgi:ribosomal protein S18